jgi:hypothetical protein
MFQFIVIIFTLVRGGGHGLLFFFILLGILWSFGGEKWT